MRDKNPIKKAILIFLAVLALGSLLFVFLHGIRGFLPAQSLGDNPGYKLPESNAPAGEAVDSVTLVENAAAWNGRTITFTGETIGEFMARGDMAWIHLNDDSFKDGNLEENGGLAGYNSGHAVWIASVDATKISMYGDYTHSGDIVKVTGEFHAACREHGGDMDIHAVSLVVLQPGHAVSHEFAFNKALIALALCIVSGALFAIRRMLARK